MIALGATEQRSEDNELLLKLFLGAMMPVLGSQALVAVHRDHHIALLEKFEAIGRSISAGPMPEGQAPDPLVPNNRFGSPDGSIKHFLESRETTEQYLRTTPGLRDHVMDGPVGKIDGYEFILFIAVHSERHTKQINEVKADPNFPKS